MVFKVLSKMIKKAEVDYISFFLVEDGKSRISHRQFSVDTMTFYDVDVHHMGFLRRILCYFEAMSSLNINLAKNELFKVGEVPNIESLA